MAWWSSTGPNFTSLASALRWRSQCKYIHMYIYIYYIIYIYIQPTKTPRTTLNWMDGMFRWDTYFHKVMFGPPSAPAATSVLLPGCHQGPLWHTPAADGPCHPAFHPNTSWQSATPLGARTSRSRRCLPSIGLLPHMCPCPEVPERHTEPQSAWGDRSPNRPPRAGLPQMQRKRRVEPMADMQSINVPASERTSQFTNTTQ